MTNVRGLLLASTATRNPLPTCALASPAATSWQPSEEDCTGASDKSPVRTQHAGYGALSIDRKRVTQARHSCLEPDRFVGKVPMRRTVSLCRSRVPKPQRTQIPQGA